MEDHTRRGRLRGTDRRRSEARPGRDPGTKPRTDEAPQPRPRVRDRPPEDALLAAWIARLAPEDRSRLDRRRQLDLVNALLPTRLWFAELDAATKNELRVLVKLAPQTAEGAEAGVPDAFHEAYFALLGRLTGDRYPRAGGRIRFVEFTAIYPIGTFNDFTDYKGHKIPLVPDPGASRAHDPPENSHSRPHSDEGESTAIRRGSRTCTSARRCTTRSTRSGGGWSPTRPRSCRRSGRRTTRVARPGRRATSGCCRAARCRVAAPT